MTDDEAFIRAILDAPGDDAPRLVYADWLDERDDPRGAYLRAEAKWAKSRWSGIFEGMFGTAEGLDPVWVARVSRPPVGLCCTKLEFEKRGSPVGPDEIRHVEDRVGVRFPPQYRAFLLSYNGGRPSRNEFPHPRFDGMDCEVQAMFSVLTSPNNDFNSLEADSAQLRARQEPIFREFVAIGAADEGWYSRILMGTGNHNCGEVYIIDDFFFTEFPPRPARISMSLGEFFALLQSEPDHQVVLRESGRKA